MHQPVRDNLEEYLRSAAAKFDKPVPREMEVHLESCSDCVKELERLTEQSAALRSLRAPTDLDPRAGFYARVMQRIEDARATNSVWTAFLEPLFAKRLVFSSVALVLLLGTYLISTEPGDMAAGYQPTVAVATPDTASATTATEDVDSATTPRERDAVLVDLAAYRQ